jgi:hypothetical protein
MRHISLLFPIHPHAKKCK